MESCTKAAVRIFFCKVGTSSFEIHTGMPSLFHSSFSYYYYYSFFLSFFFFFLYPSQRQSLRVRKKYLEESPEGNRKTGEQLWSVSTKISCNKGRRAHVSIMFTFLTHSLQDLRLLLIPLPQLDENPSHSPLSQIDAHFKWILTFHSSHFLIHSFMRPHGQLRARSHTYIHTYIQYHVIHQSVPFLHSVSLPPPHNPYYGSIAQTSAQHIKTHIHVQCQWSEEP